MNGPLAGNDGKVSARHATTDPAQGNRGERSNATKPVSPPRGSCIINTHRLHKVSLGDFHVKYGLSGLSQRSVLSETFVSFITVY